MNYPIRRAFSMPHADTLRMAPILDLARKYITGESVDPFARNCMVAKHRNDLNPDTLATDNMDAIEWLRRFKDGSCDSAIVDPPYSPRQVLECYQAIGREKCTKEETQTGRLYKWCRIELDRIMKKNGVVLWFGWSSTGMTEAMNWEIVEMLICNHGGGHNDTIATVWKRKKGLFAN